MVYNNIPTTYYLANTCNCDSLVLQPYDAAILCRKLIGGVLVKLGKCYSVRLLMHTKRYGRNATVDRYMIVCRSIYDSSH